MEAPNEIEGTLAAGSNAAPRLQLGEVGYTGLKICNGMIMEEMREDLRFPQSRITYRNMAADQTIGAALNLLETLISRVEWYVDVPEDASEDLKKKAAFLQSCMHDMDHSWYSFIREVCSYLTYGFSVHEKVYRRRVRKTGSKYKDGLIGFKKLAIRSQDTIKEFKYSGDGRTLLGVVQDLKFMPDAGRYMSLVQEKGSEITIPIEKVLLFRTDAQRGNPEGRSPLSRVYLAYRYITEIREQEAIGITRDLAGMPVLSIPPRYMSEDASPSEKAVYEYYKKVIRNIQNNEQTGLILPQLFDPESRQPLFDFKLMGTTGGKSYNTNDIVQRYSNEILQGLLTDILKLGSDGVGSYSLADQKSSLVMLGVESRLREIQDVLNSNLVRQLFELNGWDVEVLPTFEFKPVEQVDMAEFAKGLQQLKATSLVVPSARNINYIAKVMGLPDRVDENISQEELDKLLGKEESRAGDGLAKGTGNGTSDSVSERDNSASNLDNK